VYSFRIQLKQQSFNKSTRENNSKKTDEENRYFIQLYDQGAGLVPGLLLTPFPVQTVQAGPATGDRRQKTGGSFASYWTDLLPNIISSIHLVFPNKQLSHWFSFFSAQKSKLFESLPVSQRKIPQNMRDFLFKYSFSKAFQLKLFFTS